jgi:hypothetical protein
VFGSTGVPLGWFTLVKAIHWEWFAPVGKVNSLPVALGPLNAQIVALGQDGRAAAAT